MAVTISNLSFEDLPATKVAGNTNKRYVRYILSGTASAATDSVVLTTYKPGITIESAFGILTGNPSTTYVVTSFGAGSVVVGTTSAFQVSGLAYY